VSEWTSLRVGFLVVGLLLVAALISWAVQTATYEDPAFEQTRRCLVDEQGRAVAEVSDPIAQTAELGALRTVIETNGVTVAELRDRTVYLWDRPPSPTQRQALFDCTY
jgi:hypothetical protein